MPKLTRPRKRQVGCALELEPNTHFAETGVRNRSVTDQQHPLHELGSLARDKLAAPLQRCASLGLGTSSFASLSLGPLQLSLPSWIPFRPPVRKPAAQQPEQPTQKGRHARRPEGHAGSFLGLDFAAISVGDVKFELPRLQLPQAPKFSFPSWVILAPPGHPDKKRLITVQDFFKYTAEEGRQFFEELDRDSDNCVTEEDLKLAMRRRNLPESYAAEFVKAARGNRWWSSKVSWDEFQAVVDEREPKMLRAFTSMEVNSKGELDVSQIKGQLHKMGLAATDENAKAMIKALGAETDGFVSYGRFRNFLILLPDAKLATVDPSMVWFEAATMVPFGPPGDKADRTGKMLLQAALAGGIASCTSTLVMHPLDTLKTRVQSTAGATIGGIVRSVPQIGVRGLYRGIIPAASGSFVSHGLRTFSYEASFKILRALTGGVAELQIQGLASGVGTVLGTCIRIPCEVLKQRLQVGRQANVIEGLRAATEVEGVSGLFRGTSATLAREVPFYVFGMVGYEQLKKLFRGTMFGGQGRELANWEMVAIGGLAGALASVTTTPADVMKTRIMTASASQAIDTRAIFLGILRNEGIGAFFKGALPRALWIAPLGAMNFAGYELAKRALSEKDKRSSDAPAASSTATAAQATDTSSGAGPGPDPTQPAKAAAASISAEQKPAGAVGRVSSIGQHPGQTHSQHPKESEQRQATQTR